MISWKSLSLSALLTSVACSSAPAGEVANDPPTGSVSSALIACAGKVDGFYCDVDKLATCASGVQTKSVVCSSGCAQGSVIGDDRCAGDICDGIPDGSYCVPEEQAVYTCTADRTADKAACALGCSSRTPPGHDVCRSCDAGQILCGTSCLNGASDLQNCGACGNACHDGTEGTAVCKLGHCGFNCQAGFADCDGNLANGCEAALSSVSNCGGCGIVCRDAAQGAGVCTAGSCGLICKTGYADCDGNLANGCEAKLDSATSCGRCGNSCAAGTSCVSGACSSAQRITFDHLPDGSAVQADRYLSGDEYKSQGVHFAGAPEGSYCAEGTKSAILLGTSGVNVPFLTTTAASMTNILLCNSVPIGISFTKLAHHVSLTFAGASVTYLLKAYDAQGTLLATVPKAAVWNGGLFTVSYASPSANISRVTFGYTTGLTAVTEIDFE